LKRHRIAELLYFVLWILLAVAEDEAGALEAVVGALGAEDDLALVLLDVGAINELEDAGLSESISFRLRLGFPSSH
jgi:hypothetical protein